MEQKKNTKQAEFFTYNLLLLILKKPLPPANFDKNYNCYCFSGFEGTVTDLGAVFAWMRICHLWFGIKVLAISIGNESVLLNYKIQHVSNFSGHIKACIKLLL